MKETAEQIFEPEEAEVITLYPEPDENEESVITFWFKDGSKLKIDSQSFIAQLGKLGYRKYFLGKEYIFVYIENNIVEVVEAVHMKDRIRNYMNNAEREFEEGITANKIMGKVINQTPTLFSRGNLEWLDMLDNNFKRDNRKESYFYFENCFVRVTRSGITVHNYEELDGLIWKKQIINREFHLSETESDFKKFIYLICREDEKRYNSFISVIGYLLNGYKDPANAKAIIFMDEKVDDGANGGCGKSLLGNAISRVRKSLRLGGKGFKFDRFSFQSYEPGTNIIEFNDLSKGFPFEMLFTAITDNIAIEKKNKDEMIVPFEYSPKILLSTNHTVKGVDESTLRRQFILEFSDYFNIRYTPEMEFKKRFFDDWNEDEWNSFFHFMIRCELHYLQNGLVDYERVNVDHKKLVETTAEEFVEYMEDVELDKLHDKKDTHQKFVDSYPDFKNLHQKTFTNWIKLYAKLKGLKFETKKSGVERGFILSNPESGRMDELETSTDGEGDVF